MNANRPKCQAGCGHTQQEHNAFDDGMACGEQYSPGEVTNPYRDPKLRLAWDSGYSVGQINRRVTPPSSEGKAGSDIPTPETREPYKNDPQKRAEYWKERAELANEDRETTRQHNEQLECRLSAALADCAAYRKALLLYSLPDEDGRHEVATKALNHSGGKELLAEVEGLRADKARLDWLEKQAKESSTGISFDWCRYSEEGQVLDHGFRFMRRYFLGDRKPDIRAAIDAARARGEEG